MKLTYFRTPSHVLTIASPAANDLETTLSIRDARRPVHPFRGIQCAGVEKTPSHEIWHHGIISSLISTKLCSGPHEISVYILFDF